MNLLNDFPALRQAYYMILVSLWTGATIANVATILGKSVHFVPLAGISVFIGVMLVRSVDETVETVDVADNSQG